MTRLRWLSEEEQIHNQLVAMRRFVHHLAQCNLTENWPDPAFVDYGAFWGHDWQAKFWEGVVGLHCQERGFNATRVANRRRSNVDFDLSSHGERLYVECVLPTAGRTDQPHSLSERESSTVDDGVRRIGLRIVGTLIAKNLQIRRYLETGVEPGPAIVFVNTAFMTRHCALTSADDGITLMSPVVASVFGSDGVPRFDINNATGDLRQVVTDAPTFLKPGSNASIERNGFRDNSLPHISALVHLAHRSPAQLASSLETDSPSFASEFAQRSELILNPTAAYPLTKDVSDRIGCKLTISIPDITGQFTIKRNDTSAGVLR